MRASFSAVLLGILWYFWLAVTISMAVTLAVTSLSTFIELMVPSTTFPSFHLRSRVLGEKYHFYCYNPIAGLYSSA